MRHAYFCQNPHLAEEEIFLSGSHSTQHCIVEYFLNFEKVGFARNTVNG